MRARNTIRAGTTSRSSALGLAVVLLLVVVGAWAVRSAAADRQGSVGPGAAAVASAEVPSLAPTSTADIAPEPVDPIRTEAEVTGIATKHMARLAAAASELGLTPVPTQLETVIATRWADVSAYEPRVGAPDSDSPEGAGVVWVARGEGTFLVSRGRSQEPRVGSTGYLLIDDETGEIMGMGTP